MPYPEDIEKTKVELVRQIREYVILQKEEWQKVPYLTLQSSNAQISSSHREWAYKSGLWRIPTLKVGVPWMFVDCGTGHICTQPRGDTLEMAPDSLVLELANRLNELSAKQVQAGLRKTIEAYKSDDYPKKARDTDEAWRKKVQQELGLKEVFQRDASSSLQYA